MSETVSVEQKAEKTCECNNAWLIVDDEPFNLVVLETMLQQVGIESIVKAKNGLDAVNEIR